MVDHAFHMEAGITRPVTAAHSSAAPDPPIEAARTGISGPEISMVPTNRSGTTIVEDLPLR
jgi:hypothetical protein